MHYVVKYIETLFGKANTVRFLYHLSLSFLLRLEWLRTTSKCLVINHVNRTIISTST
eukprot:UN05012